MMTIEATPLTMYTTFSRPALRIQNTLKRQLQQKGVPEPSELRVPDGMEEMEAGVGGCAVSHRFTPYSATLPWHSGSRGVASRLFPRYGNYCGPNWSSGRESGSLIWDKEPIDALDFCCYKHDMGYDSLEQEDLHRADLVFLNCLQNIPKEGRSPGNSPLSEPYRNLYIFGLELVLIPYRRVLLQRVDEKTRKRLTVEEKLGKDGKQ